MTTYVYITTTGTLAWTLQCPPASSIFWTVIAGRPTIRHEPRPAHARG